MCVDSAIPHLDRPFDYAIPESLRDVTRVGTRARVRFAGRLVNAVVTGVEPSSSFEGTLTPLHSVSAIPSYTPDAIAFAGTVARRYGGNLWDVLRLMAPPRVAAVERRDWGRIEHDYRALRGAAGYLAAAAAAAGLPTADLARGARLVWEAPPDPDRRYGFPAAALAAPSVAVADQGQSAIIVVPDARAVAALVAVLEDAGLRRWTTRTGGHFAVVHADDGATTRFASYVAAMTGTVRLVIGTRPVALQPVPSLGLITVWDCGAQVFEDPHAPYPHARTVAAMRAEEAGAGALFGGITPTIEAMALVAHGWAERIDVARPALRVATPLIDPISDERRAAEGASGWHWMPGQVWRRARTALANGPVGIVVPRAGYVRATACAACGTWAECPDCASPLRLDGAGAVPRCGECGRVHADWHCPDCHGSRTKQLRQGVERIAEQVRLMAGEIPVVLSAGAVGTIADGVVTEGIVVATPAALPAVDGGYAAIVIVGADVPAGGRLGAELHALRWWLNIAALARSRGDGGEVIVVGELPAAVRDPLVAWTPAEAAADAYAERAELGLPPNRRAIRLWGEPAIITLALSVSVEGERIERHRDVTVAPSAGGVTLLVSRRAAQGVVDTLRRRQQELSRAGDGELRMRVDAPLELST